jgi:hypothetical protein
VKLNPVCLLTHIVPLHFTDNFARLCLIYKVFHSFREEEIDTWTAILNVLKYERNNKLYPLKSTGTLNPKTNKIKC